MLVSRDCLTKNLSCLQAAYFNNYLYDPKRPQLPEHPSNRAGAPQVGPHPSGLPLPTPMAAQPLLSRPPLWPSSKLSDRIVF